MKLTESQLNKLRKKYKLTQRESEIIKVLFLGINENREIANSIKSSFRTVGVHLANIYKKTGCNNKLSLTMKLLDEILKKI